MTRLTGRLRFEDSNELEYVRIRLEDQNGRVDKAWLQNVGTKLANSLIIPEIKSHFDHARRQDNNKGLRVRLNIESPKISSYPWEAMYYDGKPMAAQVSTPLTRFIPVTETKRRKFSTPLKILVIRANPADPSLPSVNLEQEIAVMKSLAEEAKKGYNNNRDYPYWNCWKHHK